MDGCLQQYEPINDSMIPTITFSRPADENPTEEELDKEIYLLESEIMRELEDTADLHGEILAKLSEKADDTRVSESILEKQLEVLDGIEKWLDQGNAKTTPDSVQILQADPTMPGKHITLREAEKSSLDLALRESKDAITSATEVQQELLNLINLQKQKNH